MPACPTKVEEVKAALRSTLFGALDEADLNRLAESSAIHRLAAGETLFHQEDAGSFMVILLEGSVRVERTNLNGSTTGAPASLIRGRGELLGEMALFGDEPRMADVVAVDDIRYVLISKESFHACLARSPAMAKLIIANLARRLRQAWDRNDNLLNMTTPDRLYQLLRELAGAAGAAGSGPVVTATQDRLANLMGRDRSVIARALAALEADGRIRRCAGKITLLRLPAL